MRWLNLKLFCTTKLKANRRATPNIWDTIHTAGQVKQQTSRIFYLGEKYKKNANGTACNHTEVELESPFSRAAME